MSEVSITVPAEYAERFKREALDTLAMAAKGLEEAADWQLQGKDQGNRLDEELPRMRAAEDLLAQVQQVNGGQVHVTGSRRVVGDTLDGCALHAVEDIHGAVESVGGAEGARAFMAELEAWLTLREFPAEGEVA